MSGLVSEGGIHSSRHGEPWSVSFSAVWLNLGEAFICVRLGIIGAAVLKIPESGKTSRNSIDTACLVALAMHFCDYHMLIRKLSLPSLRRSSSLTRTYPSTKMQYTQEWKPQSLQGKVQLVWKVG